MTATAHGSSGTSLGYTLSTAKGDGTTDDTAAIQAAIDACPTGGTVYLAPGTYKITSALTINKAMRLMGGGSHVLFGDQTTYGSDVQDVPMVSPFLAGTVIKQATSNTDAIQIPVAGMSVHLQDFGVTFATPFANTGHAIKASPTTVLGAGYEQGLVRPRWQNVNVFGHDGDHYAFYCKNHLYGSFDHLSFYGGGGLYFENDKSTAAGNMGNLLVNHLYGQLFCNGTAHGIRLKATRGTLNLFQFNRPQISITIRSGLPSPYNTTTAPDVANSQKMFKADAAVNNVSIIQPDFEFGPGLNYSPTSDFPTAAAQTAINIDPAGLPGIGPIWSWLRTGYVGREMRADLVTQITDDHTGLNPIGLYNSVTGTWGPSISGDGSRIKRGFLNTAVPRPSARVADISIDPVTAAATNAPVYSDGSNWSDLWSAPTITALTDVSNLQFDLDPDSLGLSNTQTISTFTNHAGTGANFSVSGTLPYRVGGGFQTDAGTGIALFDGTQTLTSATNCPTGGFTDFYVIRPTTVGGGVDRLLFDSTTTGAIRVYISAVNPNAATVVLVGNHAFSSPIYGVNLNAWQLLCVRYDAASGHMDFRIDSTPLIAQITDIQTIVAGATRFGVSFVGQLGRAARYTGALTDNNMKSVEKYLRAHHLLP